MNPLLLIQEHILISPFVRLHKEMMAKQYTVFMRRFKIINGEING